MGMRVGSSSSMGASQTTSVSNWQQNQQNFKALSSALQSGDLAAAQKAFANMSSSSASSSSTSSNSNSPLAQLEQALQNGDLKGAQAALQAIQSKHHHHDVESATPTAAATPASTTVGTVVDTKV